MNILYKHIGLIVVISIGLLPVLPLFHEGLPITHDGQDHVARIANFYLSLSEGNIIPRWAANLNWGYGHPILMFLYPLPSYSASFFHFLGFSFVDSVKIIFGLSYILSGITMYLFVRNVFSEKAGILSAVLYMYAPYRFVDFYVRGAIGEHVAFIFAPLILYCVYKLAKTSSPLFLLLGGLSITGLLLSHNALALMFLPIIVFYMLFLVAVSKQRVRLFIFYSLSLLIAFGLSSFFLIPAFFEGKYTLRDIVTSNGEYKTGFVNFIQFVIPSWSYGGSTFLSKQIGLVQISAIVVASVIFFKAHKKKNIALYILFSVSLLISLFLMTPYADFLWERITILQKFQFPWRLLSVVVLASALLPAFAFTYKKKSTKAMFYLILMCTCSIIVYYPYYQAREYLIKDQRFYSQIYKSTTDTGESSPIWSVRFMEKEAKKGAEIIEGSGNITRDKWKTTQREYTILSETESVRIRENTLYFPNWEVYVDGKKTNIEFQDRLNRGLITYRVPQGKHKISIQFNDTKLRTVANIITFLTVGVILLAIIVFRIWRHIKRS